ncbi:ParB/RepB/Spo0J family partition protein [Methylocystis sp. B8]|uniref:ParB/RepB/Spo0J family partition protein n=1 Tax=Methylocystis sp. B8 TaxID=544938 RepID=UPI0010FDBAC3|nr:ParB/RepB/Spo0J family partition protein [Methylocystis sp. B8]TLG71886.1 ParB/RepB/Spo0J family partition protein [Methylocystis sp. B8]
MSYAQKLDDVALLLDELEGLEPAIGNNGAPLEIALSQIEEDPGQPRRNFDQAGLEELSASIRERGLLQPIGVTKKQVNGKHRIVFGARRFRAANLARLTTIKAIIQAGQADDPYDQMVENIQRDDLSATEIAAFIEARLRVGEKQKDIARRLAKSKGFVAMHASIGQMPQMLRDKLSASPLRAVYELYQLWKRDAARVEEFCAQHETFTRRQAEAFVERASAKPSHNDDSLPAASLIFRGEPSLPQPTEDEVKLGAAGLPEGEPFPTAPRKSASDVIVRVRHEQRGGRLILGRASKRGSHFGIVAFDDHGEEAQVSLAELALVEIRIHEPL